MIELEYLPPYQSFGQPLTPEILEAIGVITDVRGPEEESAPANFEFWTTTSRRGVLYQQGRLELAAKRESTTGAKERRLLRVRETRISADESEQREHQIDAEVVCGDDLLWSPSAWRYSSWMHDPSGRIMRETVLLERGTRNGRKVKREFGATTDREILPGTGALAMHWGVWEAVRHFPRTPAFSLRFDCLEHLRKLKRAHRIRFLDTVHPNLNGSLVRLHRFVHYGQGILPTEYFIDDYDRLLLVIDGNRAAVASALRPQTSGNAPLSQRRPPVPRHKSAPATRRSKGAPPNILFVCTDQQHWRALSAANNPHLATPAMDALCRRGIRFQESYCTNPICAPSRSSLFTGRMPSETGVNRLDPSAVIRDGIPTIGEWLGGQAGYDCVYAGKWHVPACHSYDVPGFRVLGSGQDHRGDISDVTVSHAVEAYLRNRRQGQPFLLVASLTQPHDVCDWLRLNQRHKRVPPFPLVGTTLPPLPRNFRAVPSEADYVRRYREEKCEPNIGHWDTTEWRWYLWNYYRMVEMADAELGRILAVLEATGQTDNTLVIFTSDHGEGMGEHRLDRKNFHYEAAIKVPLVFSWPGRLPGNRVNRRSLVSGIDLVPTMCAFAGVAPPPLTTAMNLRPLLESRTRESRAFLGVEVSVRAVGRVLRTPRFKYAVFADEGVEQLFDMKTDAGETRNLAGRAGFRDALREHRRLLAEWEQRLDPVPDAPGAGVFAHARQ